MPLPKILLAIPLLFLWVSCTNSTEKSKTENPLGIEMNQGEKWQVNSEMYVFIHEFDSILNSVNPDDFEAQKIGSALAEKNSELISSCTMKGKAHDELHKWLVPHLSLTENLKEAQSKKEKDLALKDLESSMNEFHAFFKPKE